MSTQNPYITSDKFASVCYPTLNATDLRLHSFMLNDYTFFIEQKKHYSPDQKWLAYALGINVKTVQRSLEKLYDVDLVELVESNQKTNTYKVKETKCLSYEEIRNQYLNLKRQNVSSNEITSDKMSPNERQNVSHTNLNTNLLITNLNKEVIEVKDEVEVVNESAPSTVSIPSSPCTSSASSLNGGGVPSWFTYPDSDLYGLALEYATYYNLADSYDLINNTANRLMQGEELKLSKGYKIDKVLSYKIF